MIFGNKKSNDDGKYIFKSVKDREKNDFLRSLDDIKPNDLGPIVKRKKVKNKVDIITDFMLILCAVIFIGSLVAFVTYSMNYIRSSRENDIASDIFHGDTELNLMETLKKSNANISTLSIERSISGEVIYDYIYNDTEYNEGFEQVRAKLMQLRRQNKDLFGWINIPDSNIDYPIVLGNDNSYYLTHTFNNKYNTCGSIFADYRLSRTLENNKNLVIYGHNIVANTSMFHYVIDFSKEEIFNRRKITIMTVDGIYTYEVFAVYNTAPNIDYCKMNFIDGTDFISFVNECKSRSIHQKDIQINENDKILTLSTCTVMADNRRWAVHAKLIGISK